VADHVVRHVRKIVDKAEAKPEPKPGVLEAARSKELLAHQLGLDRPD
jgi:hypothetical protein